MQLLVLGKLIIIFIDFTYKLRTKSIYLQEYRDKRNFKLKICSAHPTQHQMPLDFFFLPLFSNKYVPLSKLSPALPMLTVVLSLCP